MGEAHRISRGFITSGRPTWSDQIRSMKDLIPFSEESAHRELRAVEVLLAELPVDTDGFGLIHFDFDNIHWKGDTITGVFDFDDCAFYWFEADIASALDGLFDRRMDGVNLQDERLTAFLTGYRSRKPIGEEAIQRIPLFVRFCHLPGSSGRLGRVHKATSLNGPLICGRSLRRLLIATGRHFRTLL